MTRSPIRRRGTPIWLGVIIVASATACHSPGAKIVPRDGSGKTTAENEQEVVGSKPASLGGPVSDKPGVALRQSPTPVLENYIERLSDDSLVAYLDSLQYDRDDNNSEIENVTCVHADNTPCLATETAQVFIEPEVGAHRRDHRFIPKFGYVVARIINYDKNYYVANFGFPPDTTVWWVVDRDPTTNEPRSRYFKRNYSATPPAVTQVGATQHFFYCGHVHKEGHTEAIAKYVSCSQSLTMGGPDTSSYTAMRLASRDGSGPPFYPAAFRSSVPVPRRPMMMAISATWITCDMGCCSTSQ